MRDAPTIWHIGGSDVDLRIPLLKRLRSRGFDVAAVGTSDPEVFAGSGIPLLEYRLKAGMGPLADLRARSDLIKLMKAHQPDIVHAFDTKPGLIVPAAAADLPGTTCIRTITGMGRLFAHDGLLWSSLRGVYRAAHRRVSKHAAMTVFQNEDDQAYFLEHDLLRGAPQCLVRGSGVDIELIRKALEDQDAIAALKRKLSPDGAPVVMMIARLVPMKGVREYLEAARTVHEHRGARFVLVGPVDETERSSRVLMDDIRACPQVKYLGRRSDVPQLLAASDLFVLPTYYREGLPRVLLEAAALDVPLIATGVPGCRDVVHHEATGLVVPPRDGAAIARAVQRLLDDPILGRNLAAGARTRVAENFSLDRVAADYTRIYEVSLGSRPTSIRDFQSTAS